MHAPATTPELPWLPDRPAMHPSFLYEIAFQLAAFAVLLWLRSRVTQPGELFVLYVAGYAVFRFFVEFVRANDTVWLNLTRPQWFLLPSLVLIALRLRHGYRRGYYDPLRLRRRRRSAHDELPPPPAARLAARGLAPTRLSLRREPAAPRLAAAAAQSRRRGDLRGGRRGRFLYCGVNSIVGPMLALRAGNRHRAEGGARDRQPSCWP